MDIDVREYAIKAISKLASDFGLSARQLKTGTLYAHKDKGVFTIYTSGKLDTDNLVEIALSHTGDYHGLMAFMVLDRDDIDRLVSHLTEMFDVATPKGVQKWPRVALNTNKSVDLFCSLMSNYKHGVESDLDSELQTIDEIVLDATDAKVLREVTERRGQANFRERLIKAYGGRCAFTGTALVDVLEAAHIIPHSVEPDYSTTSGILLRSDIHTLYDKYMISVNPETGEIDMCDMVNDAYQGVIQQYMNNPGIVSVEPSKKKLEMHYAGYCARVCVRTSY